MAFFSLEMSSEQLATRLLGEHSRVPSDKIRRGEFKSDDFPKFVEAVKTLSRAPLFIDDTPGLSVSALRTRARRLKRQAPHLGLIVIDYLQLLHGTSNKNGDNRVQEVSENHTRPEGFGEGTGYSGHRPFTAVTCRGNA